LALGRASSQPDETEQDQVSWTDDRVLSVPGDTLLCLIDAQIEVVSL
jgi:hypothetical protein